MAKAKTTRKKRRKTASKKLAFSPKNIGKNAKVIAPIALGIILSNVANKVVPTKDPLDDDSKGVPALVIKRRCNSFRSCRNGNKQHIS